MEYLSERPSNRHRPTGRRHRGRLCGARSGGEKGEHGSANRRRNQCSLDSSRSSATHQNLACPIFCSSRSKCLKYSRPASAELGSPSKSCRGGSVWKTGRMCGERGEDRRGAGDVPGWRRTKRGVERERDATHRGRKQGRDTGDVSTSTKDAVDEQAR